MKMYNLIHEHKYGSTIYTFKTEESIEAKLTSELAQRLITLFDITLNEGEMLVLDKITDIKILK